MEDTETGSNQLIYYMEDTETGSNQFLVDQSSSYLPNPLKCLKVKPLSMN